MTPVDGITNPGIYLRSQKPIDPEPPHVWVMVCVIILAAVFVLVLYRP
jgi:hypothetical protein